MRRNARIKAVGVTRSGMSQDNKPWDFTPIVLNWVEVEMNGVSYEQEVVADVRGINRPLVEQLMSSQLPVDVSISLCVQKGKDGQRYFNNIRAYLPKEYINE